MSLGFAYDESVLVAMRQVGDPIADSFIARCFADSASKKELYNWIKAAKHNADLDSAASQFAEEEIFKNAGKLPAWADEKLLVQGGNFFARFRVRILQLLGLLSLPYCYAAADGAMVLYLSERLRKDTSKRLADTGEFVLSVQKSGAFSEKGNGFTTILKTRLTHAIARFYTLDSGKWNESWGYPVNQEDMAGTGLAFSLMILRGLRKTGITISNEDQHAFLHLWGVISYLLGVDERLVPMDGKAANQLEKIIRLRQFKPSVQGQELTKALIESFTQLEPEAPLSAKEVKQLMSYLLGPEVSVMLGIDPIVAFHTPYFMKIFPSLSAWNPYLTTKKII